MSRSRATGAAFEHAQPVAGRVTSVTLEGPLARVELDCGFPLVALITAQSAEDLGIEARRGGLRDREDHRSPRGGALGRCG
jgi:hypothetical protein